jgi:hypothetical protein
MVDVLVDVPVAVLILAVAGVVGFRGRGVAPVSLEGARPCRVAARRVDARRVGGLVTLDRAHSVADHQVIAAAHALRRGVTDLAAGDALPGDAERIAAAFAVRVAGALGRMAALPGAGGDVALKLHAVRGGVAADWRRLGRVAQRSVREADGADTLCTSFG